MVRYLEAIEQLPAEFKLPIMKAFELFREEIAETVKKSDFEELKTVVGELAEAQKRTEEELRFLVTEVKELAKSHKELKAQVGGLSHTVGYHLEDESYKALPDLLKRDFGVEIEGRLKRDYVEIRIDEFIEVNIWGRGRIDGKGMLIIGEAKTQLKRRDVDRFIRHCEEVAKYVRGEQLRVFVTYQASPQVQKYAKEKNIKIYFSYEF